MKSPVNMRSCLFHPAKQAMSWGGHAHIRTPIGDVHLIIGLCIDCRRWDDRNYANNAVSLANHNPGCIGCYGTMESFR